MIVHDKFQQHLCMLDLVNDFVWLMLKVVNDFWWFIPAAFVQARSRESVSSLSLAGADRTELVEKAKKKQVLICAC
jgi:hypothetical protein